MIRTFKKSLVMALTAAMVSSSVAGAFPGTAKSVFACESARQMAACVKTKAATEVPKADVIDVSVENGTVKDNLYGKHEMVKYGEPIFAQDEVLGKEAMTVDGTDGTGDGIGFAFSDKDWTDLGSNYSFECMVKLGEANPQELNGVSLVGAESKQSDGKNAGGNLIFVKNNKGNNVVRFYQGYGKSIDYDGLSVEKWVHIVATYDGTTSRVYANGIKIGAKAIAGGGYAETGGKHLNIGCKVLGMKSAAASIASVKVYSRQLSDQEIRSLYQQEENTKITVAPDAVFVAAKGDTYTVPKPAVTTATGTAAEIATAVKDPKGNDVILNKTGAFIAAEQGEYKILYTANGTTLEKILRVTGEPGVAAETELAVGDQEALQIQNLDRDAKVEYVSADPETADIDERGTVRAKKVGETAVKITVNQAGHTYPLTGKIIVTKRPNIIDMKAMTEGDEFQLVAADTEPGAKITYTSTAPGIVEVSADGEVKAKRAGAAEIHTAVAQKGKIYNLNTKITVKAQPRIIDERIMTEGDAFRLAPVNTESDAKITYASTNPEVAVVSTNGEVRAKRAGTAEIRTTVAQSGKTYILGTKITVKAKPIQVIKPTISVTRKTVLANHNFKINVGRRASGCKVSFKTDNKRIAAVNGSGYVKGIRDGKTMIVTTVHQCGKVFTYKTAVTVKGYVNFTKVKKTIKRKKSYTFKAKAYGTGTKLKWTVSNKKLAKISKKGKFTAKKKKGKVYVIVRSGKATMKFLVKIK